MGDGEEDTLGSSSAEAVWETPVPVSLNEGPLHHCDQSI